MLIAPPPPRKHRLRALAVASPSFARLLSAVGKWLYKGHDMKKLPVFWNTHRGIFVVSSATQTGIAQLLTIRPCNFQSATLNFIFSPRFTNCLQLHAAFAALWIVASCYPHLNKEYAHVR